MRKQTMKNAERYTTDVLKEREREILTPRKRPSPAKKNSSTDLIAAILEYADALKETAAALAEIDVFIGWGVLAREWDYCKPQLDNSDTLHIDQGRHPVVEQMMREQRLGLAGTHAFVPNDTPPLQQRRTGVAADRLHHRPQHGR